MGTFPGPSCLGRGAVVTPGQPSPDPLSESPRIRINPTVVADHEAAIGVATQLRRRWAHRRPTVVGGGFPGVTHKWCLFAALRLARHSFPGRSSDAASSFNGACLGAAVVSGPA